MLVLFDNGTPRTLARFLVEHHLVTEARARGWGELENGELLNEAEAAGFRAPITTDKNLSYQQSLTGHRIAIVVLGQGRWTLIKQRVAQVVETVNAATPGSFAEVDKSFHAPAVFQKGPPCNGQSDTFPARRKPRRKTWTERRLATC
jgi:hypothetical protein